MCFHCEFPWNGAFIESDIKGAFGKEVTEELSRNIRRRILITCFCCCLSE